MHVDMDSESPIVANACARHVIQWNPKYGCRGTVTTCFALIALVAWQYSLDSTLRKPFVHPKYG